MHEDQIDLRIELVERLVADQFPAWRGRPITHVPSHGTVNALFRLGDDLVLRFPLQPSRRPELAAAIHAEQATARLLAGRVPVAVPEPVSTGEPSNDYPGPWSVYRWITGEPATAGGLPDETTVATELAAFVHALRAIDTEGRPWDGTSRGGPLRSNDSGVRQALAASTGLVDTVRVGRVWEDCLHTAPNNEPQRWIHADLMPGNLLLRASHLAAVIDLGAVCVGDPAVDLMPAWCLFSATGRGAYRNAVGADDDAWERGRGWAIVQAIIALPYYQHTNKGMADTALYTLAAVLE